MTVILTRRRGRLLLHCSLAILSSAAIAQLPAMAQRAAAASTSASEDTPRRVPIKFQSGRDTATVQGQVRGYDSVDHALTVKPGQAVTVTLKGSNSSTYFNVIEPGETPVAVFTGSRDGLRYAGTLDKAGDYLIRVYQTRNAARRGNASYTLSVSLH